ncbi:MAG: acetate--CoA ligase family protein [Acidimicrobiales bacterium]|nr:acetate--CoA ligase family protein [Acidimicrobiales bacterium]
MSITLSEAESRRVVAGYGVPVSPFVTGTSTDAVVAALVADDTVTYPVVAKLCGRAIAHKTERGLVRLHIADEAMLRSACNDLLAAAQPSDGDVEVLVSTMVDGNRELIAGLADDPQFGLTVMVGIGGILAEAIRDVAFRLVPIAEADAAEMIDDLATQRLLGEFRGEPEVDRQALIDALVALANVGQQETGVRSVDLNPLIIVDGKPVAVDALLEIEDAAGGEAKQ